MPTFTRTRAWTLPVLSFKERTLAYVKIQNEMIESSYKQEEGKRSRGPATVCRVINLEDYNEYDMIVPALVQSTLKDKVRDYVGKCFEIRVTKEELPGKTYKGAEVYEIEEPKAPQAADKKGK